MLLCRFLFVSICFYLLFFVCMWCFAFPCCCSMCVSMLFYNVLCILIFLFTSFVMFCKCSWIFLWFSQMFDDCLQFLRFSVIGRCPQKGSNKKKCKCRYYFARSKTKVEQGYLYDHPLGDKEIVRRVGHFDYHLISIWLPFYYHLITI